MSTMLNFKHGAFAGLKNQPIKNGTIYVTTDEKAMYVDLDSKRIRLSQIITLSTLDWQKLTPPYSTEAFYYLVDSNALLKYNGDGTSAEGWVQINSTAALESQINTLNKKLYGEDGNGGDINTLKTDVANLSTDLGAAEEDIAELNSVTGYIGKVDALPASANVGDVCIYAGAVYTWVNDASQPAEGANVAGWKAGNESARIEALKARVEEVALAAGDKTAVEQLASDVSGLKTDMTSVKDKLSDAKGNLLDVSDIKTTADAALPAATFETFKTTNTTAIGNAEKAAKDYADAEVKKLADGQVATNKNDIADIKSALQDANGNLLDVSDIKDKVDKAILKDGTVAMEANLNVGSHKIINVAAPEADNDAANKSYVDAQDKKIAGTNDDGSLYTAQTVKSAYAKASQAAADAATGIADAATAQGRADEAWTLANGKATIADVEAKGYAVASEVVNTYATKTALDGVNTVANRADAAAVENKSSIDKMLEGSTAKTFKALEEQIANAGTAADKTYATKTELATTKTAVLGEENYGQTVKSAYVKAEQGVTDAAAALAEAQKKTTMADVEAKGYATKSEVATTYATKTEAQGYATDAAALVRGETAETVASVDAKAEKNKTDIAALDKEVDDLRDNLLSKIQTADAMTYEGTVASEAELLAKTGVNKGDTYKATAEFKLDGTAVRIGDLLIAQGAEDVATGVIANPIWDHVPSGYHADYVPEFSLTDGGPDDTDKSVTLNLTSAHAGDDVGDLGKVTFSVAQDSAITLASTDTAANVGTITIGLAWSTF